MSDECKDCGKGGDRRLTECVECGKALCWACQPICDVCREELLYDEEEHYPEDDDD